MNLRTIERDLILRLQGFAERNDEGRWQLVRRRAAPSRPATCTATPDWPYIEQLFPDPSLRFLLEQLQTPRPSAPCRCSPHPRKTYAPKAPRHPRLLPSCNTPSRSATSAALVQSQTLPRPALPADPQKRRVVPGHVEGERLKNFSVALMADLQVDEASRLPPDPAHQDYINAKDDVWFTQQTTEVLLRVAPEVAHYFSRRALLPQQKTAPRRRRLAAGDYAHQPHQPTAACGALLAAACAHCSAAGLA